MKRQAVLGGAVAILLAAGASGGAWLADWGPFDSSLDPEEQSAVDTVKGGDLVDPADAARFVGNNLDVLLSADVAEAIDGPALAGLFAKVLQNDGGAAGLLTRVTAAVADQGEIYDPTLPPIFASAVAVNMGWIDERVNAPFNYAAGDRPDEVRQGSLNAHDFLRELFRDADAAETLSKAVYDYGLAQVAAAPDGGHEREVRLQQLGSFQTFFLIAQANAEIGQAIARNDSDAVEDAENADAERSYEANRDRAVWLAVDLYNSDPAIRAGAQEQPFVDPAGGLKADMTPDEKEALREWAVRLVGTDTEPGPIQADENQIDAGSARVRSSPQYGVSIEDRY